MKTDLSTFPKQGQDQRILLDKIFKWKRNFIKELQEWLKQIPELLESYKNMPAEYYTQIGKEIVLKEILGQ